MQASVEGQGQSQALTNVGQYQQTYVPSNYPNVGVQTGSSGDIGSNPMTQTAMYPTAVHHPHNYLQSYSKQYDNFSQNSYYGQNPSPVFYSVSSSNPQMGYSLGGLNTQIRATTPPTQVGSVANPTTTLNIGPTMSYTPQPSGTAHSVPSAQFGSYPMYQQVLHNQIRPVNQVVHIPGVQSHTPSPQFSVVRQINVPVGLQTQGTTLGPQPIGVKGYTVQGCVQKQSVESGKEGTAVMPAIKHVPGPRPTARPAAQTSQQTGRSKFDHLS